MPELDTHAEVFLGGDQTLALKQTLARLTIAIVALSAVASDILKSHLRLSIAAIDNSSPGSFQAVNCGVFTPNK